MRDNRLGRGFPCSWGASPIQTFYCRHSSERELWCAGSGNDLSTMTFSVVLEAQFSEWAGAVRTAHAPWGGATVAVPWAYARFPVPGPRGGLRCGGSAPGLEKSSHIAPKNQHGKPRNGVEVRGSGGKRTAKNYERPARTVMKVRGHHGGEGRTRDLPYELVTSFNGTYRELDGHSGK